MNTSIIRKALERLVKVHGCYHPGVVNSVSKEYAHAAGSSWLSIWAGNTAEGDLHLQANYESEGCNILSTTFATIGAGLDEAEFDIAVDQYARKVSKVIADSYAMRLHVMDGWWVGAGDKEHFPHGRMVVRVLKGRTEGGALRYEHPGFRTPAPCTIDAFKSWAIEYLGEVVPADELASIDPAWQAEA